MFTFLAIYFSSYSSLFLLCQMCCPFDVLHVAVDACHFQCCWHVGTAGVARFSLSFHFVLVSLSSLSYVLLFRENKNKGLRLEAHLEFWSSQQCLYRIIT